MIEWLSGGFFIAGATLALLAGVGVLRMPDVFTRMQASTKASTLGLGCLLVGVALRWHEQIPGTPDDLVARVAEQQLGGRVPEHDC